MAEGHADDPMIEIGDPTEEPTTVEPSPQVVIQYHERGGVPWMLIPPLLVTSAVGAILLYHKLAPRPLAPQPLALATATEVPGRPRVEPIVADAKAIEAPPMVEPIALPPAPIEAVAEPVNAVETESTPVQAPAPAPAPRVEGLGFDPRALEAERRVEAPADPALAVVARDPVPDDRDKPREVDPDLLPPDPRLARIRQDQRRLEMLRRVEEDRLKFHVELKEICLKFREDAGPEILELRKKYAARLEPAAEKKAAQLLGKNGKFLGADRRTRIDLLRSLGYPEPAILGDLFETYGVKQIGQRDGPRNPGEALYMASQMLLRNPPSRETNLHRADMENGSNLPLRNAPASSLLGNGTGPVR